MKYKKLTITNFRTFKGKHTVEFPDKKGLFLVHANNGVGKSGIYHAFRYVLFGESYSQETRKKLKLVDFLSIPAAEEKDYSFNVKLEFEHENIEYELLRGHKSNLSKGSPLEDNHFSSSLSLIKDGDIIKEKDIKTEIDNLIRKDISDFFIVDNEYVGDLFNALKSSQGSFIKKAIDQTIGVGILEDGKEDLEEIHEKYGAVLNKEAQKSKEQEKLSIEYVQKDELFKASSESLKSLQKDFETITKKVEKLQIKRDSFKIIEENVNERKEVEKDLEDLNNQKEIFLEKLQQLIVDEWYAPASERANQVLSIQTKLLDQKNKKDNEISNLNQAIKDLKASLKNKKCHTCKQDLPKGITSSQEKELSKLEQRRSLLLESKDETLIIPHPQEVIKYSQVSQKLIEELETGYFQVINEINKHEKRLKDLTKKLKDGDNAEVRKTVNDLEEALLLQRETSIDLKKQETINEFNRKKLEEVTRKLSKTFTGDTSLNKIVKIADNLRGLLEKSHEEFSIDAKTLVEQHANIAHEDLSNYPKGYKLEIDEDYIVSFLDNEGKPVGSASMGQGRIIAVSLMAGLSGASVTNAPYLIDSPMVGLDKVHSKNLLKFLPKMSEQVILLVPPGEWVENEHRKIVSKDIVGEVTLQKIDKTQSQIKEGYVSKHLG